MQKSSLVAGIKLVEAAENVRHARGFQRVENLRPPALVRQEPDVAQHG